MLYSRTLTLRLAVWLLIPLLSAPGQSATESPLRYKPLTEKVYYQINISLDLPSESKTYAGRISYEPGKSSEDSIGLKFQGRLTESSKQKPSSGGSSGVRRGPSRGPRGPGFRGGPPRGPSRGPSRGPMGLFGRGSETTALQQSTANIQVDQVGEILSLSGSSQIPLPLGHLSLLVLDALPPEAGDRWTTKNGVLLGSRQDSRRVIPRRPFDTKEEEKTSSGSEEATYVVTGTEGAKVSINKDYRLDSPNSDVPFEFGGSGTLVFNSQVGMYDSADLKYKIQLSKDNVTVTIPVSIRFNLLSADEVKKQQQERQQAADSALAEGMEKARARFTNHTEEQIAAIYAKGGQVPPTGSTITPQMEVPVGLIIQNKWPNDFRWSVCRVAQVLAGTKLKIQSLESKRFFIRDRNTLSLPPEYVEQPEVSKEQMAKLYGAAGDGSSPEKPSNVRIWKDSTGKFSIEATLVKYEEGEVTLLLKVGNRKLTLPLERLSEADQEYLRNLP